MILSAHHAAALKRKPVPVPKVVVVKYRGSLWYAQRTARGYQLLQRVPQRKAQVRKPGASGPGLLGSPLLGAAAGVAGLGTVFALGKLLAPVLDTSLQSVQCKPGNPNYPACLTPGGSAAALQQSIGVHDAGLPPAVAAQIVAEAQQSGGLGGGSSQGLVGGDRPALRER